MRCMICNQAETLPGLTSVLLQRNEISLTFNNVPVQICPDCGEAYADETVTANLLRQAEEMAQTGMRMDVREYELMED